MSGERILIVDDNPVNLRLASFLMKGEGYAVATASDARDALAKVTSFRPHLILMDIQLPGMDGLDLSRLLKGDPATRSIVILALTAYEMKGDEERVRLAGCDGYVAKPIDTRTLPAIVAGHLRRQASPATEAPAS
jgi:CheY-like chemotaxis protein